MDQVPVGHAAVFRRILAHWCDHDSIAKFDVAHTKRREKCGRSHVIPIVWRNSEVPWGKYSG